MKVNFLWNWIVFQQSYLLSTLEFGMERLHLFKIRTDKINFQSSFDILLLHCITRPRSLSCWRKVKEFPIICNCMHTLASFYRIKLMRLTRLNSIIRTLYPSHRPHHRQFEFFIGFRHHHPHHHTTPPLTITKEDFFVLWTKYFFL